VYLQVGQAKVQLKSVEIREVGRMAWSHSVPPSLQLHGSDNVRGRVINMQA